MSADAPTRSWAPVPGVALCVALGLAIAAGADALARDGRGGAFPVLWLGVLLIFGSGLVALLRADPGRGRTAGVVLAVGLGLYLVKVLHSPAGFTFHDELSTLRTVEDIRRTGGLYSPNPLIPVHPTYPGLEIAIRALSSVTGASAFTAGVVVVALARIALLLAVIALFGRVLAPRAAGIAALVYAANPNFIFFGAQVAYESFALPLAVVALVLAGAAAEAPARRGRRLLGAGLMIAAVVVCHPLTSYALIGFLALWGVITRLVRRDAGAPAGRALLGLAGTGAVLAAAWGALVASGTKSYLAPVLTRAAHSVVDLIGGQGPGKKPFTAPSSQAVVPPPERLLAALAVLLALGILVAGLRRLRAERSPLALALGLSALLYPASLALRFTQAGAETSNRASEFVFLGIGYLAGLLAGGAAWRARPRLSPRLGLALAGGLVLFAGGVVIGWARYGRVPGPYLVGSDMRSIEPDGIATAQWTERALGSGNRIVADRTNGMLTGAYGLQEPLGGSYGGVSLPTLVMAPAFSPRYRATLSGDRIRYVLVDQRLADGLPGTGIYFQRDEPSAYAHVRPPQRAALTKLDAVCPVDRVFDSGPIVIYDVRSVTDTKGC